MFKFLFHSSDVLYHTFFNKLILSFFYCVFNNLDEEVKGFQKKNKLMKKIRVWLVNIDARMTQPVRFHVHFQYPELFSSSCGAFINAELLA